MSREEFDATWQVVAGVFENTELPSLEMAALNTIRAYVAQLVTPEECKQRCFEAWNAALIDDYKTSFSQWYADNEVTHWLPLSDLPNPGGGEE